MPIADSWRVTERNYMLIFRLITTIIAITTIAIARPNIERARVNASTESFCVVLLVLLLFVVVLIDHTHPSQQEILLHYRSVCIICS